MAKVYLRYDEKAINKVLQGKLTERREVQEKAISLANNLFARAHTALMRDFFEHKITQELKGKNTGKNISGTLGGHEGNLFAFLGFWDSQDPTWELEELLSKINIRKTSHRGGIIYFSIDNIPNKSIIRSATKMNWGNASWAEGVETGNFEDGARVAHFIFKWSQASRSKTGIQTEEEYASEEFSPKPYMTEILNNFRDRINNSSSKFLV